jgi:hypothetical protein
MLPRNSIVHWRSFRRLLWPTHSSRPGARTRLTGRERRRRARDRRQRAAPLQHGAPCRPRTGTSSNKTTRPRDRSAHTTRQATRGNSSTQTASRCVGSGRAGSRPHTRCARPIGRRANDERAAQHSVAVAAAAAVVRRASGVGHTHAQRQPTTVVCNRVCNVLETRGLSLTSDQRVGGRVNARAHSA